MKKTLILLSALTVNITAFAQFSNYSGAPASSNGPRRSSSLIQKSESFNDFHVCYAPTKLITKNDQSEESEKMNSVSAGYLRYMSISQSNVFFNLGLDVRYNWQKESDSQSGFDYTSTINFLDIKIPFGLTYKLTFNKFAIAPFIGFDADIFALGKSKTTTTYSKNTETITEDIFKDTKNGPKRFVFGWHVGAKIFYDKVFFGVNYEGPISNFYKKGKTTANFNYCSLSLGIAF